MNRKSEEGSVLLLILGLVVVAALFVTVVIDVSTLYLQRRSLMAGADGAALAGAQAIDKSTIYREGLPVEGPLPLDNAAAAAAVHSYIENSGLRHEFSNLQVEVETDGATVTVFLSARVQLPVTNGVTPGAFDGVDVDASAAARTPVMPG